MLLNIKRNNLKRIMVFPDIVKHIYFTEILIIIGVFTFPLSSPPEPKEDVNADNSILIGLTGDVMLGRLVNEAISRNSYFYPWGDVLHLLKSTDLNLINLETTLTTSNNATPKVFNFKADPDKVQCLSAANIDVVTIANNHILDFSEEGLIETIENLEKAGIKHVGSGINKEKALQPAIITRNNIKIGILGYTDNEPNWEASISKPGTNYARVGDIAKIQEEIKKLRPKVNVLIFTMHWGPNMRQKPSLEFINFAHKILDTGVDIFHGHSAHIFQGIEIYNNKLILYDTGDFVDDYMVTPSLRNDQSFLYLIEVDKSNIKKVQLIPVLISNMQVNKATGADYIETVSRIKALSKEFGTEIVESDKGVFVRLK